MQNGRLPPSILENTKRALLIEDRESESSRQNSMAGTLMVRSKNGGSRLVCLFVCLFGWLVCLVCFSVFEVPLLGAFQNQRKTTNGLPPPHFDTYQFVFWFLPRTRIGTRPLRVPAPRTPREGFRLPSPRRTWKLPAQLWTWFHLAVVVKTNGISFGGRRIHHPFENLF